jgi:hypothetical protein
VAHQSHWTDKADEMLTWAGFTMFVAITFPFFSALLSFFGGFAFAPTTYFVRAFDPFKF